MGGYRKLAVGLLAAVVAAGRPLVAQEPSGGELITLERAMRVALANSRTLADAEAGLDNAEQRVREAWASAMPDISANMSYSRSLMLQEIFLPAQFLDPNAPAGEVVPIQVGSDNNWSAAISASQPLFEYSVFAGVGAAGKYRAWQEEVVRGTTHQVMSAVRQAYFDALLAIEELRLTEESIRRVTQTLEETRAMNRAGLASEYDVLRLEVEHQNIQSNLRRARNAVAARKRSLLIEMGLDPTTPLELEGRLNEIDLADPDANTPVNRALLRDAGSTVSERMGFETLMARARTQRSDLRQLRSSVQLEEARASVEKAQFFPTISVFSNYNLTAQENGSPNFFGETANQRTSTAAAGFRVELPLFRGFSRFARVQQAQANARQNETRLARAELEAENQIRTLLDALEEARLRAASQRQAVATAVRGFEIASAEYREGIGSQLQVTDAEVALTETQVNYARAVYDYLTARAQLEYAVGTVPETPDAFAAADGSGR